MLNKLSTPRGLGRAVHGDQTSAEQEGDPPTRRIRRRINVSDPRVLDSAVSCDWTGAKHEGDPRTHRPRYRRSRAAVWFAFNAFSSWLLQVLGAERFDLAMTVFVDELSCRQLARQFLADKDRSTASRWRQEQRTALRALLLAAACQPVRLRGRAKVCVEAILKNLRVAVVARAAQDALAKAGRCLVDTRAAETLPEAPLPAVRTSCEELYRALPPELTIASYGRRHWKVLFQERTAYLAGWYDETAAEWVLAIARPEEGDASASAGPGDGPLGDPAKDARAASARDGEDPRVA